MCAQEITMSAVARFTAMVRRHITFASITAAVGLALLADLAWAQQSKPTVVLVHGAFEDGSSWGHVIAALQRDNYEVIAVQLPLTSLAADVQTTKRVIDAQASPVVVAGHSWGGAVMTDAAAGNERVRALVYIAAFA